MGEVVYVEPVNFAVGTNAELEEAEVDVAEDAGEVALLAVAERVGGGGGGGVGGNRMGGNDRGGNDRGGR